VEKHHQHWKFGYTSRRIRQQFRLCFSFFSGGRSDRSDQAGNLL